MEGMNLFVTAGVSFFPEEKMSFFEFFECNKFFRVSVAFI